MVRHIILFNPPPGTPDEVCIAMARSGKEILSQIPGVLGIWLARNADRRGYQWVYTIDVTDREALAAYYAHPIHVQFAEEQFRPMAPDRLIVDADLIF